MKIEEVYVPFGEYRTYCRLVGQCEAGKKPLLLLHGGPGSTHNYFEVLDALAERSGRQLVMYDQLGCGESYLDGHPELWTKEFWAEELINVRRYLGLSGCHILGHSWGGMLLMHYMTACAPEGVESLILSNTLPSSKLWGIEQERIIAEMPEEMRAAIAEAHRTGNYSGAAYDAAEAEYMLRHCGDPDGTSPYECMRRERKTGREAYVTGWGPNEFTALGTLKDFDVTDRLPGIQTPALIISGGNDTCTPFVAKTLYDALPNARWELFRTCRHMTMLEEPEKYMRVLAEWMDSVERKEN